MNSQVAVLRTRPDRVVADYGRLLHLLKVDQVLPREQDLILKLNLSWTKYFPACSTQPWQLDGVLTTLLGDGYDRARLFPVENKTVVTDPVAGCRNNRWEGVLRRHGLPFIPLPDVEWVVHRFRTPLLRLNDIFPEGIEIPRMFVGKNVLHLPTVKCVHPDTEVLLADGRLVRAEALVKTLQVHEPVELLDGDRYSEGEVRIVSLTSDGLGGARATHFWRTPASDRQVWTVRTRTGREVTTSRTHPFLTPDGWRAASEIRLGDRIAIARHVRIEGHSQPLPAVPVPGHDEVDLDRLPLRPGRKRDIATQRAVLEAYLAGKPVTAIATDRGLDWRSALAIVHRYGIRSCWNRVRARVPARTSPDFWRWIGYFVAEGDASDVRGSYRISVANTDPGVRADYIDVSRALFGVTVRWRVDELYFDALNLQAFFESLGFPVPTNAATKAVPDLLFQCPDQEIAAFLQAYLDGDGTVDRVGVSAVTKSRRLAHQVQMLLARIGVVASVTTIRRRATNGRRAEAEPYWHVAVHGDDVVALAQWIRFRCAHKQRKLDALVTRRLRGRRPSNWDTVPVPPPLFRMIRTGLGLTREATGRASSVNNIERGYTQPTRPIVRHFADVFVRADRARRFTEEIRSLKFLASNDIAWDSVVEVRAEPTDVPFLYDLSVEGTHAFVGNGMVLHNTHGHTVTTGAIKNAFGGLLKEVRHYAHEFIHEVMVDLVLMQRELHPSVLAVMDGTVMGDGAGPRTMRPREGNLLLASADSVAIDAVAARIMGFDPLEIPYLRMCHERGLGAVDPRDIDIVGDIEAATTRLGFATGRSLVIWGDQLIRRGPLRPFKRLLLHSPLMVWAPFASNVYHDLLWYPTIGRARIRGFAATGWGRLFERYR